MDEFNPNGYVAIVPKEGWGAMVDIYPKDWDLKKFEKSHYIMPLKESIKFTKNLGEYRVYVPSDESMETYLKEQGVNL